MFSLYFLVGIVCAVCIGVVVGTTVTATLLIKDKIKEEEEE